MSAGRAGRNLSRPAAFEAFTLTTLSAAIDGAAMMGVASAAAIKVVAIVFMAISSEGGRRRPTTEARPPKGADQPCRAARALAV